MAGRYESIMLYQKSDSGNRGVLLEEDQSRQISSRSILKRQSLSVPQQEQEEQEDE